MRDLEKMEQSALDVYEAVRKMRWEYEYYQRQKSESIYISYFNRVLLAFYKMENACLQMRRLAFEASRTKRQRKEIVAYMSDIHDVSICQSSNGYEIHIPLLLPHRKNEKADFIDGIVMQALDGYEKEHMGITRIKERVVCFRHCYDKSRKMGMVRDHDNIEKKRVLDLLRLFFLETDNGIYLDTYDYYVFGERDETVIEIMEKGTFADWLQDRRMKESMVEKHEKDEVENPP